MGAKKETFETALEKLEKIARDMESGVLSLDESISKYEDGIKLSRFCKDQLEEAERKIEILQKGKDKKVKKKQVKVKEHTGEISDDEDLQGSLL